MDVLSYLIGLRKGKEEGKERTVIDGDCTFSDANHDGNIKIERSDD